MDKFDVSKNYYEILGVTEKATVAEITDAFVAKRSQLKKDLDDKKITQNEYNNKKAELTEACNILTNPSVKADYDEAREEYLKKQKEKDNEKQKVISQEDDEDVAKKGRGCLIPLTIAALIVAILAGISITIAGWKLSNYLDGANLGGNGKPPIETTVPAESETGDDEVASPLKNFGDATNPEHVAARVETIQAQLSELGVVNLQTGLPYTDEEITAIIQFVNGAFKPEKEADAYTMVDEYLNFVCGFINTPKTLNMIQYQANSDVVTKDIVDCDIKEVKPFDFTQLLMGDSYCHESIAYFNDCYARLLSTSDKEEYKKVYAETYQALANLVYGDGQQVGDQNYTMIQYSGLNNQNDAVLLWSLVMALEPFRAEGVQLEYNVHSSQAGDVVVPIDSIHEEFNALCAPTTDLTVGDDGLYRLNEPSNFAANTQVIMINSALQNMYLGNTDAYQNGYQYSIKKDQ